MLRRPSATRRTTAATTVAGNAARRAFCAERARRRRRFHAPYEPATSAYATRPKARRSAARPSWAISGRPLCGRRLLRRVVVGALRRQRPVARPERPGAERAGDDHDASDAVQRRNVAVVDDGHAPDVLVRVAEHEAHPGSGVGVAVRRADGADERHVLAGELVHLRWHDLRCPRPRYCGVDDEDRQRRRYRQGNHEPGRTGAHGGIVARLGGAGAAYALRGAVRRLAVGNAIPVLVAERAGCVLGERVAVSLAVCGAQEGRDDLEIPLAHVCGLTPEIGEAEVDIELEQVDTGRALGHVQKLETESDGIRA